jgi:hypothetical protein
MDPCKCLNSTYLRDRLRSYIERLSYLYTIIANILLQMCENGVTDYFLFIINRRSCSALTQVTT